MCVSLPGLFPLKVRRLQSTQFPGLVACISKDSAIYLTNTACMQVVKVFSTSGKNYQRHVFLRETNVMWLLDVEGGLFVWRLPSREGVNGIGRLSQEVKDEVPMQLNPMPLAVLPAEYGVVKDMQPISDKDFFVLFSRVIYVLQEGKDLFKKSIKRIRGEFMTGRVLDRRDAVLFITDLCELYFANLSDLLDSSQPDLRVAQQVKLGGNVFLHKHHLLCTASERLIVAVPKSGQTLYSWSFGNGEAKEIACVVQKPWKKLAEVESNQVCINPYIDSLKLPASPRGIRIFDRGEQTTTCLLQSYPDLNSLLYILGTTQGRVFIFPLLMKDLGRCFPMYLSLIHICRCRRLLTCRSRWSP
eukprot:TRINITY_DN3571_c0_g6_i2.p1 TRINITY_DN3571_c0_g6~~TRINITY_DN3571_c0_g6_i2.p1  ORF type:complete len:358 (-),score=75.59 TRINITY_DN3571_c0_g6_i2:20-1093(-)